VQARIDTPSGSAYLQTPLLGRANLANVLAGIAVALGRPVCRWSISSSARAR